MQYATLAEIVATAERFKQLSPVVTRVELHDQDQIPVLLEHIGRDAEYVDAMRLTGIPIVSERSVPIGMIRLVLSDGTATDISMV